MVIIYRSDEYLFFSIQQVHGSLGEKSPTHNTFDSDNEDDSSSSSIITGGTQTPPRLGLNNDAHSVKSHTPLSIKSEQSIRNEHSAAHTRSPSSGAMAPSSSNNNLCGTTSLTSMPSTSPYTMNTANLGPPHPQLSASHFNHANPLLYQHHHHNLHHPSSEWYHSAAVAAPPPDINHLNHFNSHHHLMHHATAY